MLWSADIGAGSGSSRILTAPPVVAEGKVFVKDAESTVSAFDANTGGKVWSVTLKPEKARDTNEFGGGVAYFVEQVDERFLRRHGFDEDGALYKMDQRSTLEPVFSDSTDGVQKRTRLTENNSDLQSLVDAIHSSSPDDWARANPNVAPARDGLARIG